MKNVINIKTDKKIKESAQKTASELGLSLSSVINAYLRQFIRNKEVHFTAVPRMSAELENLLGEIEIDIKKKRNISRAFSSVKAIEKYLSK